MSTFNIHTQETAPTGSTALLADARKAYGFVPNLFGIFAEAPAALEAYLEIGKIFDKSSFTAAERQVVILAASRFNECHYCIGAHSVVAEMQKVPGNVIDAIRNDQPIPDSRLETLRRFTTAMVEQRGWLPNSEVEAFLEAGFSRAQVLEVIVGISFKTLSNYTNHITETPLDDAFAPKAWTPVDQRLAG